MSLFVLRCIFACYQSEANKIHFETSSLNFFKHSIALSCLQSNICQSGKQISTGNCQNIPTNQEGPT